MSNSNRNNDRKRRKRRGFRLSKWTIICFIAILFMGGSIGRQQSKVNALRAEGKEINKEINRLTQKVEDLTSKINNKTDIVYIERMARDELNMVRPGEIMYEDKDRPLKDENDK